jgi:GNAT superfamily N-acetyltransferase
MSITIKRALTKDTRIVAPLFNAYRMFYGQHSNLAAADNFIAQRVQNNQSVIFLAMDNDNAVGFTQLYPIFSSVGLKNAWLLNDLYVKDAERGKGIATALLEAAKEHARHTGSAWLMLQTAVNNHAAQKAYESNGWLKDNDYYVYTFKLDT